MSDVRNYLGESIYELANLCLSTLINKWSENKPHSIVAPGGTTYEEGTAVKTHGLYQYKTSGAGVYYNKPAGGASDPFRLGDFRLYNHSAGAPVQVAFTDVRIKGSGTAMSAPYTFYGGFEYQITMAIVVGEIASLDICAQTHPVKQVGSGGGSYGGLVLYKGNAAPIGVEFLTADVFSQGSGQVVDFLCELTSGHPFDIYFVEHTYDPIDGDQYFGLGWTIEDISYRDLFTAAVLNVAISSTNVVGISDPLSVMCSGILTNSSGSNLTVSMKISVSINGNPVRNHTDTGFSLPTTGATYAYDLATSYYADFVDGSNTIIGTMYIMIGTVVHASKAINKTITLDLT